MGYMNILFVEPPKEFWFVMGEYLPPPFSLVQLAGYIEHVRKDVQISILDCQAQGVGWQRLEERIAAFDPDLVAASSLATCNTYTTVRALEVAKKAKPTVFTVTGGQHFTALAQESLEAYSSIDAIVRGEGEVTFAELALALMRGQDLASVEGLSYRSSGKILHNASRPLIEDINSLPLPAYHYVEDNLSKYHFTMMTGKNARYMVLEGARGCQYDCTFCSQWPFWGKQWRAKSPKRIADEMEYYHSKYGGNFFWLTDDNFNLARGKELSREIIQRGLSDKISWFTQARCDDVAANSDTVAEMRRAGCYWMLLGVESGDSATLQGFRKNEGTKETKEAFRVLKRNDVFRQGTFIIGGRKDTAESIADLREYASDLDPDLALFVVLTPFPGTVLYKEAERQGWIEDHNWANYDMIHAVMPTETLSRADVQRELYETYRSYYGSWPRKIRGMFSPNKLKRRIFMYLASQNILSQLRTIL